MATSIEKISMDLKAGSPGGKCLVETELTKPDMEGSNFRKPSGRKKRILYDREFLIKCFHSPQSAKKPSGFPIPHLDCTLGASKIKRLPLSAPQQAYLPPKRKEEGAKRERDGEDNISLRPHSGNFSGGCGPNLTSPSHVPTSSSYSRIHSHEPEPSKGGYDRDREFHRNNFRYGGHNRRDMNDRGGRMDRDRDREMDRDHRDRMNRDRLSGSNHRGSNWNNDGPESDWSRRRNGAHFPRDRDYNNSNKRYSHDRGGHDEQEPEWFSGGPSDRHETIELRGFLDDDRRDKSDDLHNGFVRESIEQNGEVDSGSESAKHDQTGESESPMDLSIEKILKMDHIPGILPNDMLETEEPSGSSRFSQFFKRNSATPDPGPGRAAHFDQHENNSHSNDDKSKAVHEMGELLRNMLIKKNTPVEPTPEPKPKEAAKPAPATKDDVDAFKKLVTPLLEKVLMGPPGKKVPTGKPSGNEQGQGTQGGNVMDLFKTAPQQPQQQKSQSTPVPEDGPRNNPLQDIFNNMMNKQPTPIQPQEEVIRLTPNQALLMLPPELQQLVLNMNVSQNDYIMLVNLAKSNEWTFRSVLAGVVTPQMPPQQHMAYVGIFKLLIIGAVNLPGVVVINPNSQPMPPMPQPMPNHRPPNFDKIMQRPNEDGPKEMAKRSATPVSSMAFTPTSVMRKMTADGGKSVPPQNPTGFVPVPISGGLLPTPPTTAPVIMNSNNPNLASLMSTMARPHPHLQFRPGPPPMGFPPNAGFHPSMMTPNIHGPVMIPPPFQNILPNQQIYNKSEEN
ncbi:unnamed protein product [Orchesella dallaii]|uniref:Eukaryotic translation initiation factor 4E transporter n=1 Tax=Orchesella dallaii TaxID=48710 RepID=A0ABP1QZB2_9HEXA